MDDLTTALLDKAQQYLRSAAVLLELGDYDSSVSRAYFAMFYAAQSMLRRQKGELPNKVGIRTAFRERFVETGDVPERAADLLDQAYDRYERADYSSRAVTTAEEAEALLQQAEAFVNAINERIGYTA